MRLQAESPLWVCFAIIDGAPGILFQMGPIHGLEEKVSEIPILHLLGLHGDLGIDEFEFIAGLQKNFGGGLGADAQPVDACGAGLGAIGFHGNFDMGVMEFFGQRLVEL